MRRNSDLDPRLGWQCPRHQHVVYSANDGVMCPVCHGGPLTPPDTLYREAYAAEQYALPEILPTLGAASIRAFAAEKDALSPGARAWLRASAERIDRRGFFADRERLPLDGGARELTVAQWVALTAALPYGLCPAQDGLCPLSVMFVVVVSAKCLHPDEPVLAELLALTQDPRRPCVASAVHERAQRWLKHQS